MKKNLFLLGLFLAFYTAKAQNFDYGKPTADEINLNTVSFSPEAPAVVLREYGTSSIDFSEAALYVEFTHHVRLKILKNEGLQYGKVSIPLKINKKNRYENMAGANRPIAADEDDELLELKGLTINYNDGKAERTPLDNKKITKTKKNTQILLVEFDFPNVKEGSIVEYEYVVKMPGIQYYKRWDFQSLIPKLHSEYIATIPKNYEFDVSLRGDLKLSDTKAEVQERCYHFGTLYVDCSRFTYVMKDVAPLAPADYLNNPLDRASSINFLLHKYGTMSGAEFPFKRSWDDVDADLLADKSFGGQLKKQNIFKNQLPKMTGGATDDLGKAKAIYAFIAEKMKSNGSTDIFSDDIKSAFDKGTGSTADINLALIAALSAAKLNVQPFLVSSKDKGVINEKIPNVDAFNYVVAILNIGDDSYFLDASVPDLPFGSLTNMTMNGSGRAVKEKKDSYWVDLAGE